MFIDIHTHRLTAAENRSIVNLTFSEAKKVFNSLEKGFFSIGIHPWLVNEYSDKLLKEIELYFTDPRFIALGECGLDKNCNSAIIKQIQLFEKQIEIAERFQKPVIIHCVGCFNELFEIKKHFNPKQKWIIHGFRGKPQLAEQALKIGLNLSFGEYYNVETLGITPFENLYIETDESHLGIEELYDRVAIIKNCSVTLLVAGLNLMNSLKT